MSFPRSVTDDDLRDDCARVLRKMISLGARIEIAPVEDVDEWWTVEVPTESLKRCNFELAMTAVLIGRGCGIHARPGRFGQSERARFGSRRLNRAFCRALRETSQTIVGTGALS